MTDPIVEKVARVIRETVPQRCGINCEAELTELDEQRAALEAAATIHALYRELEGWRGIESAPLQGWFDVWRDGVRFPDTRRYGGGGFGASTGAWKDGQPVVEKLDPPPTHWRRLPTPPETTSGTEGGR